MTDFRPDPFERPAPTPAPEGGAMIGRRLVLALVGLGAVAVAAAGIWFAYDQGVKRGAGGGPMLIKADNGPVKTAPENPGGMQVPNQDKQVFERLTGRQMGQGAAPVENLLPPPEQPVPQAPLPAEAAPAPAAPSVPAVVAALPPATPQAAPAAPAPATPPAPTTPPATAATPPAAASPAVAAAPIQPVTPAAPAPPPPAAVPAPVPAQQAAATGPRQLTVPTTPAPAPAPAVAAAAPPPKAAAPAPSSGGNWRVQLSSVRSEADADKEWRRLKGKHPDPLNPLSARYVRVDLGEKGVWWRVQAGPVGDKSAAEAVCAKLKSQGQGCTVVQ